MTLSRGLRKLILSVHITFAVGWLGAVAGFVSLAMIGLNSHDAQKISAAYLSMDWITRFVIVPLSFAPLITGPILSLGTPWGLFRHYWILAKLVITTLSTIILLVHLQPIAYLSNAAISGTLSPADFQLQLQMMVASSAALLALIVTNILAVYKPKGMTRYGWRKQYEERLPSQT